MIRRRWTRFAHGIGCVLIVALGGEACSGARAGRVDAVDAGALGAGGIEVGDAAQAGDGAATVVEGPADAEGTDTGALLDADPPRDAEIEASPGAGATTLRILSPAEAAPGVTFPIVVETADGSPASGDVAIRIGVGERRLVLHRGRGSLSAVSSASGPLRVSARMGDLRGERELVVAERDGRRLSGALTAADLDWDRRADVWIDADVSVAEGNTLSIAAGTRVLLAPDASLLIAGELRVSGEAGEPVLFAGAPDAGGAPWGGVRITGEAAIDHAYFVGARGQGAVFGHSSSSPVLRVEGGRLTMTGGGVIDNPGKAFGSLDAEVVLDGLLVSRCDTGGEFGRSSVTMRGSHVLEIPDGDGRNDDDDNDGVYLSGARLTASGVSRSRVEGCVFSVGEDDAIDHNGAEVDVVGTFIDGFFHEGIAASNAGDVLVEDCVIRHTGQGVEAGYGSPSVVVRHSTIADNGVGVRFGDSYAREYDGHVAVELSLIGHNDQNVWNHSNALDGPVPGAIEIRCSAVDDPNWAPTDNNVNNVASVPEMNQDGCPERHTALGPACGEEARLGPRNCP